MKNWEIRSILVPFDFSAPSKAALAAAQRSDLIVLAGHSRRVGTEWMIGTTAERVLRHSPVPVLAVPTKAKLPKRRKRLMARNGIHRLPVMHGSRVVGMIADSDIFELL